MLFVLTLDHTKNVFLCLIIYGHRKLDLKFVHGRAEIEVYTSEAEIAEENSRTMSFGKKGLFTCGHIYFDKQLLFNLKCGPCAGTKIRSVTHL